MNLNESSIADIKWNYCKKNHFLMKTKIYQSRRETSKVERTFQISASETLLKLQTNQLKKLLMTN